MHEVKVRLCHAIIMTTMDNYDYVSQEDRDETADDFSDFMEM